MIYDEILILLAVNRVTGYKHYPHTDISVRLLSGSIKEIIKGGFYVYAENQLIFLIVRLILPQTPLRSPGPLRMRRKHHPLPPSTTPS